MERKRTTLLFGATLAVAAAVRLCRLDHFSYGLDEILQGFWIRGTWEFFWRSLKFDAVHPPLDYLVARGVEALGPADWARKLPDVFWGTATVAVLGALIGRRAGWREGCFAAFLLAVAPFHVRYSQEFRPYALGLFLLCLALLCIDRFLDRPGAARLLALYLACLATAYALYLAALVLAIAAVAMLAEDAFAEDPVRRRAARRLAVASPLLAAALFAAYLPWWPVVLEAGRRAPMAPRPLLSAGRFERILSFFSFAPDSHRAFTAFFFALVLAGAWIAARRRGLRFLAAWGAGGFLAIEVLGQLHPHFDTPQHVLPAAVILTPLAAIAITALFREKRLRATAIAALLLALFLDARALPEYFREGRADWRPLARFLRSRPMDEQIFTENQYSQLCVAYYLDGPDWLYRKGQIGRDVWSIDGEILRLTWSWKPGRTAWIVIAGEPVHQELRSWALNFPMLSFPTAEGARLFRLDASVRDTVFPSAR